MTGIYNNMHLADCFHRKTFSKLNNVVNYLVKFKFDKLKLTFNIITFKVGTKNYLNITQ